jgi:hypothetical protein
MRATPIGGGEGNFRETYQLKWMLKNAVGHEEVHVARVH